MNGSKAPTLPPRPKTKVLKEAIAETKVSPLKSHPIPASRTTSDASQLPTSTSASSSSASLSHPSPTPSPPLPTQRHLAFPNNSNAPPTQPNGTMASTPIDPSYGQGINQQQVPTAAMRIEDQMTALGLPPGSAAQQMLQHQATTWAAALKKAAASGQHIPGLPGNGASSEEIASAIEHAVLKKLSAKPHQPPDSHNGHQQQHMPPGAAFPPGSNGLSPMTLPGQGLPALPAPGAGGPAGGACNKAGCGHDHSSQPNLLDSESGLWNDGDDGQNWLMLYRGAYLGKIDALLAPLLTCFIALMFWTGVLNFVMALILVPFMVVGSLHFVLVKAAGMKPQMIPHSRFPCGLISSLEAWAILTFLNSMSSLLRDHSLQTGFMLCMAAVAYFLHYKCIRSDPGAIPVPNEPVNLPEQQRLMLQQLNPAWCWTCNSYKPIRSKHCSICNRCYEEFDHHCPVIANCVAKGNKRMFFAYLATLFVAEVMWMKLAILYHKRVLQLFILRTNTLPSTWSIIWYVFKLGRLMPGAAYMTGLAVFITSGTGYLLARQAFITAGNLSTNEFLLRKHRYDYLHAGDGTFYNPFDQGPVKNCVQFWWEKDVDWYGIYSARRELSPDSSIPPWSISSLLRARDRAVLALKAGREARKQRREEWLLEKYGSARPSSNGAGGHNEGEMA